MASLKKCIEQHCKNCTYDKYVEGTWRAQVEACTTVSCALHPVRPMTMETIIANRGKTGKVIPINVDTDALIDGLEDADDDEGSEAHGEDQAVA